MQALQTILVASLECLFRIWLPGSHEYGQWKRELTRSHIPQAIALFFRLHGHMSAFRWVIRHGAGDYKTGRSYGERPPLVIAPHVYPELEAWMDTWRAELAPTHNFLFSRSAPDRGHLKTSCTYAIGIGHSVARRSLLRQIPAFTC